MTPNINVARKLVLAWGVHSTCTSDPASIEEMVDNASIAAAQHGFSVPTLPLVVVAGTPFGVVGSTNLMRIVWPAPASRILSPARREATAVDRNSEIEQTLHT
jgi:pyruvate kinase